MLKRLDLEGIGIVIYVYVGKHQGADQLGDYSAANLRLCFSICKTKTGFIMTRYIIGLMLA